MREPVAQLPFVAVTEPEIAAPVTADAGAGLDTGARAGTPASRLLGEFIDHCKTRGVQLPGRLVKIYGREIKAAFGEGFPRNLIASALGSLLDSNHIGHPTWLPQRLVEAQAGPGMRRGMVMRGGQAVTERTASALDVVAQLRAEEHAAREGTREGARLELSA